MTTPPTTEPLHIVLCPFQAIFGFLFFHSFVPTDTFILKLRKVITGCLLIGLIAYFVNMSFYLDDAGNAKSSGYTYAIVTLIANIIPSIAILVSFIFCRWTMSAPDFVMGLPCLSILLSLLFFTFTSATNDLTSMVSAVIAVISMTAVGRLWYIVCFLVAFITILINCLIMSQSTTWMFPGVSSMYAPTSMLTYATHQLLVFLIVAYFLYAVVSEFDRMIHRAQGAASLSQELATKLLRYDTDGAKELLKRCVTSDSPASGAMDDALVIDAQLLEAFHGIIHNLEQYRPHLPNYLLDEVDDDELDEFRVSGGAALKPNNSIHSQRDGDSAALTERSQRLARDVFTSSRRSRDSDHGAALSSSHYESDTTHDDAAPVPVRVGRDELLPMMTTSKVTITLVDVAVTCVSGDLKPIYDVAVGMMNDAAVATVASLHSFIGDRLIATWNATKRISKPEARGSLFAIRLRDAFAGVQGLSFSSMTVTGSGESCFAGDHRLRLFVCTSSGLWHRARKGLEATQRLRLVAFDAPTRDQAAVDVTSRGLTLLRCGELPMCLYEVRTVRPQEERDQEWMYVLEQHADDPDEKVTQALHAYAAGRPSEGVDILNQLVQTTRDTSVETSLAEMEEAAVSKP